MIEYLTKKGDDTMRGITDVLSVPASTEEEAIRKINEYLAFEGKKGKIVKANRLLSSDSNYGVLVIYPKEDKKDNDLSLGLK